MNSQDKRRIMLGGGGLALLAAFALSDPIADIRVSHDVTRSAVSTIEARLDFGLVAVSILHSWQPALR